MIPADMIAAVSYQHPHIAQRIVDTWGDPLCVSYISGLLLPDHVSEFSAPKPFDVPTFAALSGLIELHDGLYPRPSDIWDKA